MKFLIDTNILIPLEPTSISDLGGNTDLAAKFLKLCLKSGKEIYLHPAIQEDFKRDKKDDRRELRKTLIKKYSLLTSPPPSTILDGEKIPTAEEGTNDWVDNQLLATLQGGLVHYLVTEDIGIHRKAKRIALEGKVLLLDDAIQILKDLFDTSPQPPPSVAEKFVYELDAKDTIFNSLRDDYDGFDAWLEKCRTEHRKAYIVETVDQNIAGLSIYKQEEFCPDGTKGKVLKLCTFKVSENHGGNKVGELLLKQVFQHASKNNYEYIYFTAYPKQEQLIEFAQGFGFQRITNKESSTEIALCKILKYTSMEISSLSPLEFNIRYGPGITTFSSNQSFIVPIQPKYTAVLFPEGVCK